LFRSHELATWQSEAADNLLIASTEEILDQIATAEWIANGPEPYDSYGATWVLDGNKAWSAPAPAPAPSHRAAQTQPYQPRGGYVSGCETSLA
jgi:hypothetical protein